jgi:predicted nucleic acid-binding protein
LTGIADTGFIVAFVNRDDQHHSWAAALARHITEPLLTCEPVLAESAFKLYSTSIVIELLRSDFLRISFDLEENITHIGQLAEKYEDRNPALADLCLIRMSEIYPTRDVLTVDSDFRVYRRNKREPIPIVCPPRRA